MCCHPPNNSSPTRSSGAVVLCHTQPQLSLQLGLTCQLAEKKDKQGEKMYKDLMKKQQTGSNRCPRTKMSHRLVSGGSPHGLHDSMSLCHRMRLYFLNIGPRSKKKKKKKNSKKPREKHLLLAAPSALFMKQIG